MHRAPTMKTETSFHPCMEQSSPTLGLPTNCARGFPRGTPRAGVASAADPGATPPCQQLILLPGPAYACTSPDCKKYCRSWDAIPGLEALYQSCPLSFVATPKVEGAKSFIARQDISRHWQLAHIRVRRHHLKITAERKNVLDTHTCLF